eukprot:TRINITY_DN6_c1_g1_i1.p1 TRINITY_DN6_c1_g1~~TRINITY_DN6_c1_g1_i1.p1  ORF type:complete len:158 (-),score=33.23 TRINITY_DN6_c1_g1_i1:104-577(-)
MLIPTRDILLILEYLFREGVLVAKKDLNMKRHSDSLPVKNLHVVKLLQSLKSKGYVKEQFNWQWYYWFLNDKGIAYLREYLHLAVEEVPLTLKKPTNTRPSAYVQGEERKGRTDRDDKRGPRGPRNYDSKKVTPNSSEIGFRGTSKSYSGQGQKKDN